MNHAAANYIARNLTPLDRDGMEVMIKPPEQFPAYLVLRLCEPKPLATAGYPGGPPKRGRGNPAMRPPLARNRGGIFSFTKVGRAVASAMTASSIEATTSEAHGVEDSGVQS